jgi:hypothetical protein
MRLLIFSVASHVVRITNYNSNVTLPYPTTLLLAEFIILSSSASLDRELHQSR